MCQAGARCFRQSRKHVLQGPIPVAYLAADVVVAITQRTPPRHHAAPLTRHAYLWLRLQDGASQFPAGLPRLCLILYRCCG